MRYLDIVGKTIGKYVVESIIIDRRGMLVLYHLNNFSYRSVEVAYDTFIKNAIEQHYDLPSKPSAFDPNDYIGALINGFYIFKNDNEDGKYRWKGEEPNIEVDPNEYLYNITLDPIESGVKLPRNKSMWCKCTKCNNILKLPVKYIFNHNNGHCPYCDEYKTICKDIDNITMNSESSNIGFIGINKDKKGNTIVRYKCNKCHNVYNKSKDSFYTDLTHGCCSKCYKPIKDEMNYGEYERAVSNFYVPNYRYGTPKYATYLRRWKLKVTGYNITSKMIDTFDPNNINFDIKCKCGNTFNITLPKLEAKVEEGISCCRKCAADLRKHIEESKEIERSYSLVMVREDADKNEGDPEYKTNPWVICQCRCGTIISIRYLDFINKKYRNCGRCSAKPPKELPEIWDTDITYR